MDSRSVTAVVLALLLLIGTTHPVLADPVLVDNGITVRQDSPTPTPTPINNTSVRHRNPDEINKQGDLLSIRSWLRGRLTNVLIDCTRGVKIGQYDPCDRLDGDYPDWLSKYVDVARETDSERDDKVGEAATDAKENQEEFATTVKTFRQTYEQYQKARDQGNLTRARQLARRLTHLAERINRTGTALVRDYQVITANSKANLTGAASTIKLITQNLTTTASRLETELFINTTLTATTQSTQISFLSPLIVSGQLTTENGTPLASRTIQLKIGGKQIETTTNATGEFTIRYRPVRLPLATKTATLRYVPQNTSVYLESRAQLPIEVRQVTPHITVSRQPARAGFKESVTVRGRVSAEDIPASGVPVVVRIAGQRLSRVKTNSTGHYTLTVQIPASIPPGEQTVRVSIPFKNRVLAGVNATNTITITSSSTAVSIAGSQVETRQLAVQGRLMTADGIPVEGQRIRLQMNGTTVGYATTGSEGRYSTMLSVPESLVRDHSENVTVVVNATFVGTGTNLNASHAETAVTLVLPDSALDPASIATSPVSILSAFIADPVGTTQQLSDWWLLLLLSLVGTVTTGLLVVRFRPDAVSVISLYVSATGKRVRTSVPIPRWIRYIFATIRPYLPLESVRKSWVSVREWGETTKGQLQTKLPIETIQRVRSWMRIHWLWTIISQIGTVIRKPLRMIFDQTIQSPLNKQPRTTDQTIHEEPSMQSSETTQPTPLDLARQQLQVGNYADAIIILYAAVREHLTAKAELSDAYTHWEFLNACQRNGVAADQFDQLHYLTQAYEDAAFAPEPPSPKTAEEVLEVTKTFTEETDIQLPPPDQDITKQQSITSTNDD